MHPLFDRRRYLIPFRTGLLPQIFTDTLVIGSGVAGLRAAIAAAMHGEVIVLAKAEFDRSCTAWAQGGISAAIGPGDSPAAHARDTIEAGAGLCDEDVVRRVAEGGPALVRELIDWGMRVDRGERGEVALGREGAHTQSRIVHASGDATGAELTRVLLDRARALASGDAPRLRLFESCFALDLLTPSEAAGSPVMGAITFHKRYGLQVIWAKATILASGGAGMVYRETSNPRVATGDGIAMAYRAGATLRDMAFVQFHPTTLYLAGAPRSLISEAVRGEGARLLDLGGRRFMPAIHEMAELAPRDVVARAIVRHARERGETHALLDARDIANFPRRFPGITALLAGYGLDPSRDPIPVKPAAHYTIGGVQTDGAGRTDAPGLYAVGEVSASGLHGANRLASNSLLEGLVLGEAAGRAAAERTREQPAPDGLPSCPWQGEPPRAPISIVSDIRPSEHGEIDLADVLSSLRSAMWHNAGIERTAPRLRDAADMIDFWARYTLDKIFDEPAGWEAQNLLLVGALIARSALWRAESRGCHWRSDAPQPGEAFCLHDAWRRGRGEPRVEPASSAA